MVYTKIAKDGGEKGEGGTRGALPWAPKGGTKRGRLFQVTSGGGEKREGVGESVTNFQRERVHRIQR